MKQLRIGNTQEWKNFNVSVHYIPQFGGKQIQFVLDNERGLNLRGNNLSVADEIALRTIFITLFPDVHALQPIDQMVPREMYIGDLHISQLVFSHGWMGLSLSGHANGLQAQRPSRLGSLPRVFR